MELLLLALLLGPVLEESFFRGCLLPLLAQTTGKVVAVVLTAFLFALFHQPADLAHWVFLTATGLAYGWTPSGIRLDRGGDDHADRNLQSGSVSLHNVLAPQRRGN